MTTNIDLHELVDDDTLLVVEENLERSGLTVEDLITIVISKAAKERMFLNDMFMSSYETMKADDLTRSEFIQNALKGLEEADAGILLTEEEVFDDVERYIDSL